MIQHFATIMEPLEASEPNSMEVKVTGDMTRAEVVEEILRRVKEMDQENKNMTQLLEGIYKAENNFYKYIKVPPVFISI